MMNFLSEWLVGNSAGPVPAFPGESYLFPRADDLWGVGPSLVREGSAKRIWRGFEAITL
jgi:hypothetical protein